MASPSPWDAYSQHTGLPASLESYPHHFSSSDMRGLTGGSSAGMSGLPGDLTPVSLNLTSPYASYAQSYPGMSDLSFASSSLRPSSAAHSSGSAPDNLPASSPHGQYSSTPTSENQSSSPSFPNSTSMYTSSTATSSISSSPYAQAFGGSSSSAEAAARGPFSFAQSYGYPVYGYNHMGGFPGSGSMEGVNRYMGGISSSALMQPAAMGLYSNSQPGQMPFSYHSAMGWGSPIPGFQLKEGSDLMAQDELERYRYRQLSNQYFSGLQPSGSPVRNFPPHPLQQSMIRTPPYMDDRTHSPPPKKLKKSTEDSERPPTPSPRDPSAFHSNRGIYLFNSDAEPGSPKFFSDRYVLFEKELCKKLSRVSLPGKIQYVYNPLEYAFESHLNFVRKFCAGEKYILFVGMNPGPFGMSQNGVPFGECAVVKEWMHIEGEVQKPVLEHPKRRVVGLECSRSEVTGGRFWQLFRTLCHTPEHFFRTSFVHSLCPFAFLTDTGKNVTPPQLVSSVLDQINALCNETLVEVVRLLKSKYVICVGKYALAQAQKALAGDEFSGIILECLMHPSPINPATNKGWTDIALKQLTEMGIVDVIRYGRIPYQAPNQSPAPQSSNPSAPSLPLNQHSQSQHPYKNKKSPGCYDFQAPPGQSYHQSAQGSASHQSPVHALNQSPAHGSSRSQSSPAHASFHGQSSPGQSSCSQSPALQTAPTNQSPSLTSGSSCSVLQQGSGNPQADNNQRSSSEPLSAERVSSNNPPILESSALTSDMSQESKIVSDLDTNGIPTFSSPPDDLDNSLENSHSDSGSPGSDISKADSPDVPYPSGNLPMNLSERQLSAHNSCMSEAANARMSNGIQMTASDQAHLNMRSGHSHMGMRLPMSDSPGLQQTGPSEQHLRLNEQIGSPHMRTQDSRMVSHGSHMGSAAGSHMQMEMGAHGLGMHGHMGSLNPYSHMEMGQMGGFGSNMAASNYSANSGMRPGSDVPGYGHHMGLYNPGMDMSMSGMHAARQMEMYNQHMSSMMGVQQENLPMHPGMSAMYDSQMGKEMSYSNHFLDKPPECS
ncbi:unnamed protein product [Candidula unifasciata]|uniref:Uracil-DNA glycosylase-like domain-containing protein n=1 Tax=Candidula unifasciata TaxID=100452 RepID=A0A8S3YSP1_9EUPU|nr:unnamed protein product [Candidula unifasciata]